MGEFVKNFNSIYDQWVQQVEELIDQIKQSRENISQFKEKILAVQ